MQPGCEVMWTKSRMIYPPFFTNSTALCVDIRYKKHRLPVLSAFIAVMQFWTFFLSVRLTSTVIFTLPTPGQIYSIIIICSNERWFLLLCFDGTCFTNHALVRIASSCRTATVEKYVRDAYPAVSSIDIERILISSFKASG